MYECVSGAVANCGWVCWRRAPGRATTVLPRSQARHKLPMSPTGPRILPARNISALARPLPKLMYVVWSPTLALYSATALFPHFFFFFTLLLLFFIYFLILFLAVLLDEVMSLYR